MAKNVIFYFTGTGNSLKIARDIAKELGDAQLTSIPDALRTNGTITAEGDTVGFVFPVYLSRPPLLLREFVSRLEIKDNPYLYGITNGGGAIGQSMVLFDILLKQKQRKLNSGFILRMPGNYQPMYDVFSESEQQKLFAGEQEKVKEVAAIIKKKKDCEIEANLGIAGHILSKVTFNKMYLGSKSLDKTFWVDQNCNNCGLCERVCQGDNIKDSKTGPKWQHNCTNCFACFHFCPKKAIQSGKYTVKRGRYHHPEITLNDIMPKK